MDNDKFCGMKDISSCVSSACGRCGTGKELMRELRGAVWILKRIGPRTELRGTQQVLGMRERDEV